MPPYFRFKCNCCGHQVETSGPHEFYRDREGRLKPCGHPLPTKEALERGIAGLYLDLYCTECGEVSSVVTVEYDKRIEGWSPFRHLIHGMASESSEGPEEKLCPSCGKKSLIFTPDSTAPEGESDEGKSLLGPCLLCGKGHLVFEEMVMS